MRRMHTGEAHRAVLLAAVFGFGVHGGCAGHAAPATVAIPEAASSAADSADAAPKRETVYLRAGDGLAAVTVPGGAVTHHRAGRVGYCAIDPRANVVWLTRGSPRELAFLDLNAPEVIVTVATDLPEVDEIIIDHGEAGRLGGADPVSFRIALALHVSPAPTIRAVVGCEGDGAVFCFDERLERLLPRYEALQRAADATRLLARERVAALHARAGARPLSRRAPSGASSARALPRIDSVHKSACDEAPEECGQARPLDGTPFWLVVTANGRGDYFHRDEQVYDPAMRSFLDVRTGARAERPFPGEGAEGLHVSPSGAAYAIDGRVATFGGEVLFEQDDAEACGWVGGGVVVGGPRG